MDLRLVEDTSVKQFSFDNDRQNIASDKVVTELRAVSKDNKFIFQLHPKNFKELHEILADIIGNSTGLGNELDISHHGGETECNFCGEKRNGYIDVPVALNIGTENELYPSVASSEVKIEMCESCIDELIEELERITEERKDIILAHQI